MDLLVNDAELRDRISNYLLSENRVAKKKEYAPFEGGE